MCENCVAPSSEIGAFEVKKTGRENRVFIRARDLCQSEIPLRRNSSFQTQESFICVPEWLQNFRMAFQLYAVDP